MFSSFSILNSKVPPPKLFTLSLALGGSLKAEGFGDGHCASSHPQAALEAATLLDCQIRFDRPLAVYSQPFGIR